MVDFKKLQEKRGITKSKDPIELFRRLPKTGNINDLWNSQAEALRNWDMIRDNKDVILKLNTGGGKTLVGLIIAQSIENETSGSTLYLCPTRQLVEQTFNLSKEYGFNTGFYKSGTPLDSDFLNGECILIATYSALFNAQSKFGTTEHARGHVPLECIILDDAHVAFSNIREYFTLSIDRREKNELFSDMCKIFRNDFAEIGIIGTFEALARGDPNETKILEVPYWSWKTRLNEVRERLSGISDDYPFVWPLLRDELDHCHALISTRSFSVTPLYPLVDKYPSFSRCPRRIYMSATLADDSTIIRTFDANVDSVSKPIIPKSLTGIGERMILVPELMKIDRKEIGPFVRETIKEISNVSGVLILVPSNRDLQKWLSVAKRPENSDEVNIILNKLRCGDSYGPYVFSNRYDGLDLPGNSCRLLIMDGEPVGENIYDSFRRDVLENSRIINTFLAQRIEQGIGRGTRGSGDHCVVILLGSGLTSWIARSSNLEQLTPSTRAQIEMGVEISKDVSNLDEFEDTIYKCINRDKDWVEYHAYNLAEFTSLPQPDTDSLKIAKSERKYFELVRDGYYDKAIFLLSEYASVDEIDDDLKGWLMQLCARASHFWGNEELAKQYQKNAYSLNRSLLKPRVESPYVPYLTPGEQSKAIVEPLSDYTYRRGYLSSFDKITSQLTPVSTPNQFEEALKKFGEMLGFHAERPEKELRLGPDVLWILSDSTALVIEAKSQKNRRTYLNKDEYGQLLTSESWFEDKYPGYKGIKVVVHPNIYTTSSISPVDIYAFTIDGLQKMISNSRLLLEELCTSSASPDALIAKCQKRLNELNLTPDKIAAYLNLFEKGPAKRA